MFVLLSLVGCLSAESFDDQFAGAECALVYECDKAAFESNYDDVGECQEDFVDYTEEYYDCYLENCEFDAGEASDCLNAINTSDCEAYADGDYLSDCDYADIFDDCDDSDLSECLLDALF